MGETVIVAIIAGAFTTAGVVVSSIFAFAGKRSEQIQASLEKEIDRLRADRDHYREKFENHMADHHSFGYDRRKGSKPDNGKRRRWDDAED